MKFHLSGYSSRNLNGSQFSLPLSNKSFLGRGEDPPNQPRNPLLCLKLSTPSFLEATIIDLTTTYPLYRIKTSSTTTTVMRRESVTSSVVASSIKWPKIIPMKRAKARAELVLVNMRDGPWRGGNSLLKPGSRNNSRKFRLPDHEYPMKWKLNGDLYWCTTPSVVGAIATLEPRSGNCPPKLTVYEDFHDEFNPPQPVYGGVPILLLDYLVVTALLLVTDLQEWSLVPKARSDQAGLESATNPPMWKEEAWYPMANRRLGAKSFSSLASTIRSGSSSRDPPATQAGPSHVHNHQRPHLSVDTDSDPEDEYVSQWTRSLSPVSETEPESFHPLHRPTSPIQGSPVPSSLASGNLSKLHPEPSHGMVPQSACPPPIRNSVIPDDIDGNVFPSVLQMIHPFQKMELERDQNQYPHNTLRNPRPLPLPPTARILSSGELNASLRSQHRSARILPSIPYISRHPLIASGLHTRTVSEGHPTLLDDPPSQNSQVICPTDDVYGHRPITKASHITQWLHSLTGDSTTTENALELLVRASISDSPPPPYNSLEFSLEQQRHGRQTMPLECQR